MNCSVVWLKIKGHKINCRENQIACADDSICYAVEEACDGFFDCPDKSDEIDCEGIYNLKKTDKIISCSETEIFTCEDNSQRICADKICDRIQDCDDSSDEANCSKF